MNSNQNYLNGFPLEALSVQQLLKIKGGVEDKRASRPGTKGASTTKTNNGNSSSSSSTKKP